MAAEELGALLLGLEVLVHEMSPEAASSAQLGNLHVEVHAEAPEEREARREIVHVEASAHPCAHILNAVGDCVGQLEHRISSSLQVSQQQIKLCTSNCCCFLLEDVMSNVIPLACDSQKWISS